MNTSFAGNQVGSAVSLDITNTYPTGLLAQLGPYYDDSQELTNAQLRFTANQADITSQAHSVYALENIELKKTGTIIPTSANTQSAATLYINEANQVNYTNQRKATLINTEYTNAYAIEKSCRDASYSAFLTTEASQVRLDRISNNNVVSQLANSPININPLYILNSSTISTQVSNFQQTSQTHLNDASGNVQAYITNTQYLLNNAIVKSLSVTSNLYLIVAFNTFVKSIAEAISFPLVLISGKELLVTQNVPSIPLTSAIALTKSSLTFLNNLISKINGNSLNISASITAISNLVSTLDNIARNRDLNMYIRDAVQNNLLKTASTMIRNKSPIIFPNNAPDSVYNIITQDIDAAAKAAAFSARLAGALIIDAATDASGLSIAAEAAVVAAATAAASISPIEARNMALNADTSAANARTVLNSIINLNSAYNNTTTLEPIILTVALDSLQDIRNMMSIVERVTSNASAHSGVAISRTASNTILGNLKQFTENEKAYLESAADAQSVLLLLNKAYSITPSITDVVLIKNKHWAVNAASARAKEVSEKLKNKTFLLNRTAHNLITPANIAVQTAEANIAGANIAHMASRIDRLSRNVYPLPPPAYEGFKADIRAKMITPIRPSLNELVFRNRITPLRVDSLRTISATNIKVAQDVQQIKDSSTYSFRKQ